MKQIAIINRQSPFNLPHGRESLDLAMIYAAFDQAVTVFFLDDGVYQLLGGQNPEQLQSKDYLATMKAFELYDIERVIVAAPDLQSRGIAPDELNIPCECLDNPEIAGLLGSFDQILTV